MGIKNVVGNLNGKMEKLRNRSNIVFAQDYLKLLVLPTGIGFG